MERESKKASRQGGRERFTFDPALLVLVTYCCCNCGRILGSFFVKQLLACESNSVGFFTALVHHVQLAMDIG